MRLIFPAILFLFLSVPTLAQDRPRVEVFGGFSYASIKTGEARINANGWHAAIAVNLRGGWPDLVADFSGHNGSTDDASEAISSAMAGVRFTSRRGRVVMFVHSIYGASFERLDLRQGLAGIDERQRVWFTFVPGGGGLDIALNQRLAVRVAQFDLLFSSRSSAPAIDSSPTDFIRLQPRLSCGIVVRFGKL